MVLLYCYGPLAFNLKLASGDCLANSHVILPRALGDFSY